MSMMANSEAMQTMRIRAEDVLERKGTGATRDAGALAGQFAAMLQALNGVDQGADPSTSGADVIANSQPSVRLGVGAVSLFAQEVGGATSTETAAEGYSSNLSLPDPNGADQVVESAINSGNGANFRWLTTLLTQNTAA